MRRGRLPRRVRVRGRASRLGRDVRLEAAPGTTITIGDACRLGDGCRVLVREGSVVIGDGVIMGERCSFLCHASITVGDGAVLGAGVMAVDFDHGTDDPELPIRLQPLLPAPVAIGARARLGHGACVLRGVAIGEGAEVGEHAVVTRNVPAFTRVEGVPARPVPAPLPAR